jgi:ABC-type spermidine/putrescine transport system permease subunit I
MKEGALVGSVASFLLGTAFGWVYAKSGKLVYGLGAVLVSIPLWVLVVVAIFSGATSDGGR